MRDNNNQDDLEEDERISWHPAFFEAIQMELDEYSQYLQFISEYQLTKEPLRIDVVIIKKAENITIEKNIASIFRKENIVEYKSPDDHVSVDDFYQVYGYACLYKSQNKVDVGELTLTFVGSRYPRELLKHFRERRGYAVEERWPGIYNISGDVFAIQVIDSRRLSEEENVWLRSLDNRLKARELRRIADEVDRQGKAARTGAYFDVVMRANKKRLLEEIKMGDAMVTLEKIFKEAGLIDKWIAESAAMGEARGAARGEARGEARGRAEGGELKAAEIARNMLMSGFSFEQTAALSGLDLAKIKVLSG
jgi:hypothetical protein